MTDTTGARSALTRAVAAVADDRQTGSLVIDGGRAILFFFLGRPVHAICTVDGEGLKGSAALDAIIVHCADAHGVSFSAGEVPAYTLEITVDEVQTRLAGANGRVGARATMTAEHDPLPDDASYRPLLPQGNGLFEGIPLGALHIEALAPALRDGAIVVSRHGVLGVVLVEDGELTETFLFTGDRRVLGPPALEEIRGLGEAVVAAYGLDRALIAVAPTLLRGEPVYDDLRLNWIDWKQFIADLSSRAGTYVIELETPNGRGVACMRDSRVIGAYTEAHPELGDLSLLDELVSTREGTIVVRRPGGPLNLSGPKLIASSPATPDGDVAERLTHGASDTASPSEIEGGDSAPDPEAAQPIHRVPPPAGVAAADENPLIAHDPDSPALLNVQGGDEVGADHQSASDNVSSHDGPSASASPEPAHGEETAPWARSVAESEDGRSTQTTASEAVPAWPPQADSAPPSFNGDFHGEGASPLEQVMPQFKDVVRTRLGRSAARVEKLLDAAAEEGRTVDETLTELRGLTIRGVMQSTLAAVADELAGVAGTRPS